MINEGCLSESEFLVKAAQFFKIANEKKITVHVSVKRLIKLDHVEGNPERDATKFPHYDVSKVSSISKQVENNSTTKYPLLIRIWYASHTKKTKCSAIVDASNLDKFWQDYSNIAKSGMQGLIKKKKKKSKNSTSKDKKKKSKRVSK
ncbi:similar to Saccharomyces cerevisiae YDL092W SRP14 Signal recognition particle (SRP) subunit [Maudiozyma barnettii]|uniref:Signal recognition particle subunit SRP14 n=1 Tax=Maudiozyma barnettii TaxID=61262 RepID=A0A8H2VKN8_9SACH|nr:RNA-binding signal recognition particle subunit SRP14 [Kazachstania barnettii]CAB4257084.1 similar to Saccharomyces cerevisiae YDL092W SRP14 Signal recognition particle (SRP) subunit [Kazachstania barnettii]CAD1779455.1 similar to Saccharomyces cerevisiae YDL092W SRP14 Signal recognition particle (SRP) subunit [Kazachstania barnettii]